MTLTKAQEDQVWGQTPVVGGHMGLPMELSFLLVRLRDVGGDGLS